MAVYFGHRRECEWTEIPQVVLSDLGLFFLGHTKVRTKVCASDISGNLDYDTALFVSGVYQTIGFNDLLQRKRLVDNPVVANTKEVMKSASSMVLGGFELESERRSCCSPQAVQGRGARAINVGSCN